MDADCQGRELAVWGLPMSWTTEDVHDFFALGGEIDSIFLPNLAGNCNETTVVYRFADDAQLAAAHFDAMHLGDNEGETPLRCEVKEPVHMTKQQVMPKPSQQQVKPKPSATPNKVLAANASELYAMSGVAAARRVQLRGLPFKATVADIKIFLGDHASNLAMEPAIRLVVNSVGRHSGFAHVEFNSQEAAKACLETLHGNEIGGRYIDVLELTHRKKAKFRYALDAAEGIDLPSVDNEAELATTSEMSALTVQLRGLPFSATVADIMNFLGDHANHLVMEPALLLNRDSRPCGFARVEFNSPEAAKACLATLHGTEMGGRYVEVLQCSDRTTDRAGKKRSRSAAFRHWNSSSF